MAETLVRIAEYPSAGIGIMFTGLSRTWPERPARVYARRGSEMTMIPGISGGAFIPGRTVHQDYGTHESAGGFDVAVPYATEAILATVRTLEASASLLSYTHDWTGAAWNTSGSPYTNLWVVVFDPTGGAVVPESNAGFPGTYKIKMKFKIIQKVT